MSVAILTPEQFEALSGQLYAGSSYFNPIRDRHDNWVITEEEVEACTNPAFEWVSTLELTEFDPPETLH